MSFTGLSDGSSARGSQSFSNDSFTSTPAKKSLAFPHPFIDRRILMSWDRRRGLSAYLSHSRLMRGVMRCSLNICACRYSGWMCSSKLKSTIPLNIRALLPSASSGRAGVAGANNRRSKEDVLPYYLVIYYLLQKYNFSVVIQNYLVYIIIKMRGLCLKYL